MSKFNDLYTKLILECSEEKKLIKENPALLALGAAAATGFGQAVGDKVADKLLGEDSSNEGDDSYKFTYQMLSRLKQDCDYFLGMGNGCEKHLWGLTIEGHLSEMKGLYNKIPEDKKPEWLSVDDINEYEQKMLELRKNKK